MEITQFKTAVYLNKVWFNMAKESAAADLSPAEIDLAEAGFSTPSKDTLKIGLFQTGLGVRKIIYLFTLK